MIYPKLNPISKEEYERSRKRELAQSVLADMDRIGKAVGSGNRNEMESLHIELDGSYQACISGWGNSMYGYNKDLGFNYELIGNDSVIHNLNTMKGKLRGYALQLDPSAFQRRGTQNPLEGGANYKMNQEKRKLLADYGKIKELSAGNSAINISNTDYPSLQETLDYLTAHSLIQPIEMSTGFGRIYMKENGFESFMERLLSQEDEVEAVKEQVYDKLKVFVVHGHDEELLSKIENLLHRIGLEPIILKNEANAGKTIIEKLEHYTNVGFCIVLYTCCDEGREKGDSELQCRARQNVVFEHGYLCAKLGRKRVVALKEKHVEFPSDLAGVVYIDLSFSNWRNELMRDMEEAGLKFNPLRA